MLLTGLIPRLHLGTRLIVRVMHTQHVDDDVILIPLIRAMANCLHSGKLRFVATLASKLLRSPSSRLQATRNASYCILRATNTATREISHITGINGPALQFSSLGCCLGFGVRGHIKSPTPLWITVPGITGGVLSERERWNLLSVSSCNPAVVEGVRERENLTLLTKANKNTAGSQG